MIFYSINNINNANSTDEYTETDGETSNEKKQLPKINCYQTNQLSSRAKDIEDREHEVEIDSSDFQEKMPYTNNYKFKKKIQADGYQFKKVENRLDTKQNNSEEAGYSIEEYSFSQPDADVQSPLSRHFEDIVLNIQAGQEVIQNSDDILIKPIKSQILFKQDEKLNEFEQRFERMIKKRGNVKILTNTPITQREIT